MTIESEIYELDIYSEICCDYCNDIIHNHFHCPKCDHNYAGTNIYGALWDSMGQNGQDWQDKYLECQECDAKFEPLDYSELYGGKWRFIND